MTYYISVMISNLTNAKLKNLQKNLGKIISAGSIKVFIHYYMYNQNYISNFNKFLDKFFKVSKKTFIL